MNVAKSVNLLLLIGAFSVSSGADTKQILNFQDAQITKHPYTAQVIRTSRSKAGLSRQAICAGAIIAKNLMLTSSHCTHRDHHNVNSYLVRAGTSYRNGTRGTIHRVLKIEQYQNRDMNRHSSDDISIITVDPPFKLNIRRQPIKISKSPLTKDRIATVAGWGYTDFQSKERALKLQFAELAVTPGETCKKNSKWGHNIQPSHFCGNYDKKDTCRGELGAPLVYHNKLIGLVSRIRKEHCGHSGYPDLFTDIGFYSEWIKLKTADSGVIFG